MLETKRPFSKIKRRIAKIKRHFVRTKRRFAKLLKHSVVFLCYEPNLYLKNRRRTKDFLYLFGSVMFFLYFCRLERVEFN